MFFAEYVQKFFNALGFQLSRRAPGVQIDSALEEQLRLLGKDAKTIFEVGAADGRDSAIYAARCAGAAIYAFEPLPASFTKLQAIAKLESRIKAVNAAVSDKSGTAKFHVTALDDASSLLPPAKTGSTFDKYMSAVDEIEVDTITLDGFCEIHKISQIDLLKMDAQGAELKILHGSSRLLTERAIKVIYSEVDFMEIYKDCGKYHEIASYLYDFGYVLHNLYGLVSNQNGRLAWGDAIFVRDDIN
jgi:FkbM family methyltransferase